MDQLKKKRTSLRISFTKALDSLNALLESDSPGFAELTVAYDLLADKHQALEENTASIIEALVSAEDSNDEVQREIGEHDEYKSKFFLAKSMFDNKIVAMDEMAAKIDQEFQKQFDEEVEEAYRKSVLKILDGSREKPIPWLEYYPEVQSKETSTSKQAIESMVRKLRAAGKLEEYNGVIQDWLKNRFIERVPSGEMNNWCIYLPHRPVFNEYSTISTLIFQTSTSIHSIYERQDKVSKPEQKVDNFLLRFREGNIGVISCVKKAFKKLYIRSSEYDYLRFLWYNANGDLVAYRICEAISNVSSNPHILGDMVKSYLEMYIYEEHPIYERHPTYDNALKLKRSFHINKCVTSVNNVNELRSLLNDAKTVLENSFSYFNIIFLRDWEHTHGESSQNISEVLGLLWDKRQDNLMLKVSDLKELDFQKLTKRKILSHLRQIYDPFGFACPVLIGPKILLHSAIEPQLPFDEEVSEDIKRKFANWSEELENLDQIKVPRCMIGEIDSKAKVSIHTFVSANKPAYAAVVFIRIQRGWDVQVRFVKAENKVDPDENILHLNLLAATMGAQLTSEVFKAFDYEDEKNLDWPEDWEQRKPIGFDFKDAEKYYWTDSATVLTWINRKDAWMHFVFTNVRAIKEVSEPKQWRHIPKILNPADLASKGCSVSHLLASRWLEGPDWLRGKKWSVSHAYDVDEEEVNSEVQAWTRKRKQTQQAGNCKKYLFIGTTALIGIATTAWKFW